MTLYLHHKHSPLLQEPAWLPHPVCLQGADCPLRYLLSQPWLSSGFLKSSIVPPAVPPMNCLSGGFSSGDSSAIAHKGKESHPLPMIAASFGSKLETTCDRAGHSGYSIHLGTRQHRGWSRGDVARSCH